MTVTQCGQMASCGRIAALMACLLWPLAPSTATARTLLTVRRHGVVREILSLAGLESAGTIVASVENDANRLSQYTGIPLAKLPVSAGIELGRSLRGEHLVAYAVIRAVEGYRALFTPA
jgi:hypothetical protein